MDRGSGYAIHAEGLRKVFRTGRTRRRGSDVVAVDGIDLAVRPGETFGLIGPDGAGKTTTIRLLTGLLAGPRFSVSTWPASRGASRRGWAIWPSSSACIAT